MLTPVLLRAGHDAIGMDSDLYRDCTSGEDRIEVATVLRDIRDVEGDDLRGFDGVVDLAGLSNDALGDLNPELTMEINHRGSANLARMAKEAGIERFVFSSSYSNYGASGEDFLDEQSPFSRSRYTPGRRSRPRRISPDLPTSGCGRPLCAMRRHTASRRGCGLTWYLTI